MEADTTLRIANLSKKVVAVKEASGDLAQFAKIIANAPEHFKVISGDDALTYPSIAIGSIGIISVLGNAMPVMLSQLTHAALNKNMELAAELHLKLSEMFKLIFREGNPAGVKALMEVMGTVKNQVRLPLVSVSAATHSLIENELKRIS